MIFFYVNMRSSKFALMVIKEVYRNFLLQLQGIYDLGEATTITDWAFEKIASLKRAGIIKDPSQQLSPATLERLNDALIQLLQHKPVQYVLGEAWFYHLKLQVNEEVLIPRPETEELVEWIITNRRSQLTDPAILDIGTGSGCIAIAIKKNLPASKITAIDLSEKALELAKNNAMHHHTGIHFLQLDFLDETQWDNLPLFDVIISNPPYIPWKEKKGMAKNVVQHEPHSALFVPDETPLIFYEKIAAFGITHLFPKGRIYVETHENIAREVSILFNKNYRQTEIKKDLFGKERMVMAAIDY